jgi:hypothetical protein
LLSIEGILHRRHKGEMWGEWYPFAEKTLQKQNADFVFIGSSRVAAAIDGPAFEKAAEESMGRPAHALVIGQGYSTPVEHYLGLRNLLAANPQSLSKVTVFVEMPAGQLVEGHLRGHWVHEEAPNLLVPLLKQGDLAEFWHSSDSLPSKVAVSFQTQTSWSQLLASRKRIKGFTLAAGRSLLEQGLLRAGLAAAPGEASIDLAAQGGILTDTEHVARARKLADELASEARRSERPFQADDFSIYTALISLVKSHGGQVVFYEMPMSTVSRQVAETEIGRANVRRSQEWVQGWQCLLLRPQFVVTDDDFPDLWHLRKSRAAEFSEQLAESWQRAQAKP